MLSLPLLVAALWPTATQAAFPGQNGKIAFTSDRDGSFEVYVMNADGSEQARVTENPNPANGTNPVGVHGRAARSGRR